MFCCRPQVALVDPIKDTPLNIGYIQHVEFISGWQDGGMLLLAIMTPLLHILLERMNFLLQYYYY